MNAYPDINTTNLFGTKTVELYNNVNNTALEFGFTNAAGQEAPTSTSRGRNARYGGVFFFTNSYSISSN